MVLTVASYGTVHVCYVAETFESATICFTRVINSQIYCIPIHSLILRAPSLVIEQSDQEIYILETCMKS